MPAGRSATRRHLVALLATSALVAPFARAVAAAESKPTGPSLPQGAAARYEMPMFSSVVRDKNGGMRNIQMALTIFFNNPESQFQTAVRAAVLTDHIIKEILRSYLQDFEGERGKVALKKMVEGIIKKDTGEKNFHSLEFKALFIG